MLDNFLASNDSLFVSAARSYLAGEADTTIYVCSFSDRNNSIGQWQRYGANGAGYCIGFERHALTDNVLGKSGVVLERMIYDRHEQESLVRERVRELLNRTATLKDVTPEEPEHEILRAGGLAIAVSLDELATHLKHPLFADEEEWRLIREVTGGEELIEDDEVIKDNEVMEAEDLVARFAPRGNHVKPYIEITLTRNRKVQALPLAQVVCGPKLDGPLAVNSARHFLDSNDYFNVAVSWSELHEIWR